MTDVEETIQIPAGVESGQQLQLAGKGHTGLDGGRPGDLYVQFEVKEDERFHRDGQNLITELQLSFAQVVLGHEIKLQGIDKEYEIVVPKGTQPGQELRVKNAGLPALRNARRGDIIAIIQIDVPKHLNHEQEVAVRALATAFNEEMPKSSGHSLLGGLFGKK